MRARKYAALVMMMTGVVVATPGEVVAQEATVQASATVVVPERAPEVTVVAEWVDGRQQPSVVISGEGRLRVVGLKVGTEDRILVGDVPGRRLGGPVGGVQGGGLLGGGPLGGVGATDLSAHVPVSIVLAAI